MAIILTVITIVTFFPMLSAMPFATNAFADVGGTLVSGIGSQCSRDNMGMSSDSAPMSSHHGYRLDYKTESGIHSGNLAPILSLVASDAGTNQSIRSTSYLVTIYRINQTAQTNTTEANLPKGAVISTVFGSNVFLTTNGNLTLHLRSSPSAQSDSQPLIHANVDPILNAWLTDPSNSIAIDNLRMVPGSYHAKVQLFGVDTPQCLFSTADTPKFDIYWNIDSNGSVTDLSSTVVPEFGVSQVILAVSISGILGLAAIMSKRVLSK